MNGSHFGKHLLAGLLLLGMPAAGLGQATVPAIFVHHSVGRNLLQQGQVRSRIIQLGEQRGVVLRLWDHDYNDIGLSDPAGNPQGYSFNVPGDNTNPDGWEHIWTTSNGCRDSLLSRFAIIAFKSCFTASAIETDTELQADEQDYLAMAAVFDQHPGKTFVVLTPPPRHHLATDSGDAARARALADWLGSAAFLSGHPNVRVFDLFDRLARPDDGGTYANTLRYDYERDHSGTDSHPNELANQTVGPELANFLVDVAATRLPAETTSWGDLKHRYR